MFPTEPTLMLQNLRHPFFLLLSLCLFTGLNSHAQQYSNWYFGSSVGLGFLANSGQQIPYDLGPNNLSTTEGSSAISDENGALLFYTDGITIYNRKHGVMKNGDGLLGNKSSYQCAVIVQMPGHDSLYYVFTTDAYENRFVNGYRYSVVNMNRDNGNGEVVQKNVLLSAGGTERITATRHANGVDVWILTNETNSNVFHSWLLTCDGLQQAVASAVGDPMNLEDYVNIGAMKVSPNGKNLCQTHHLTNDSNSYFFQLFDFDNGSGRITNARRFSFPYVHAENMEFSPDGNFLYLACGSYPQILQIEPQLSTVDEIKNSLVGIPSLRGFSGIQLAEDGKIYLNNNSFNLSVINKPNEKGMACGYQENQVRLHFYGGTQLPFVLNKLNPDPNDYTYTVQDSCAGIIQFFGHTNIAGIVNWQWDFGDGTTSTEQNPTHHYTSLNQAFLVKLKLTSPSICGSLLKTKFIIPKGILAKAKFSFSFDCDSTSVQFENTSNYSDSLQFRWSFGDNTYSSEKNPVHQYSSQGIYSVQLNLVTQSLCVSDSITKMLPLQAFSVHATADRQNILEGQKVNLSVAEAADRYSWTPSYGLNDPAVQNPIATPTQPITYFVTATNDAGCVGIDSVSINVEVFQDILVPNGFTPNGDGKNDVFRPIVGAQFALTNFSVFNRWGQLIFTTNQKDAGWNGKFQNNPQPAGIYTWMVTAKKGSQSIRKTGTVLLVR